MPQDLILEDVVMPTTFSKESATDWIRSLRRVARGQAILWHETPIAERQAILARVDAEQEQS